MGFQMRALTYLGPNQLALRDTANPVPGSDETLLKPLFIGICGTDLLIASGGMARVQSGVILGHEMVCQVVDSKKFEPGTRVFVNPLVSCGSCRTCESGKLHICERLGLYGIDQHGGLAERLVVRNQALIPLPSHLDAKTAALIEPLSVAIHMVRMATGDFDSIPAETLVIGGGPIGLLVALVLKSQAYPKVAIVEPNEQRRKLAEGLGLKTAAELPNANNEFNLVFEATGVAPALDLAIRAAVPRGRILLGGLPHGPIVTNTSAVVMKELSVVGSRVYEPADIAMAIDLLARGDVNPAPLISSIVDLDNAISQGFEKLRNSRDEMKILIEIGS